MTIDEKDMICISDLIQNKSIDGNIREIRESISDINCLVSNINALKKINFKLVKNENEFKKLFENLSRLTQIYIKLKNDENKYLEKIYPGLNLDNIYITENKIFKLKGDKND